MEEGLRALTLPYTANCTVFPCVGHNVCKHDAGFYGNGQWSYCVDTTQM